MTRPTTSPAHDELEVSVFGPGYGEAIAVHFGNGCWILIDSCIHRESGLPASREYLDSIGVAPECVKAIIASHWHDDHVRGIAQLVRHYGAAEFIVSDVFNDQESLAFLCAHGGPDARLTRGTRELHDAISSIADQNRLFFAKKRTIILEETVAGHPVRVFAFSPTDAALVYSKVRMAQQLPAVNGPIRVAAELSPNLEAVVIQIEFGNEAILLGSDLEEHGGLGWTDIVTDPWCSKRPAASIYKVAHHGSITGHHDDIWTKRLTRAPQAVLTPFSQGRVNLPTGGDRIRIKDKAGEAYLSSDASRKPKMPAATVKRLQDIAKNVTPLNPGFGSIHMRKAIGAAAWDVALHGSAIKL